MVDVVRLSQKSIQLLPRRLLHPTVSNYTDHQSRNFPQTSGESLATPPHPPTTNPTNQSEHNVHAVLGCSPLDYSAPVWRGHMAPPNEEALSILLSLPPPTGRPTPNPHRLPPPSATFQLIRNSRHIVGPLCKRKSP